jgi:hypothetical protein
MRVRLEKHVIVTRNQEEDDLVRCIEVVYKSRLVKELQIEEEPEQEFRLTRAILEAIRFFEEYAPDKVQNLQTKLDNYQGSLQQLGLSDEVFRKKINKRGFFNSLVSTFYIISLFPAYMYGLANNYIPYIIPSKVARLLTRDEVYMAPIMMTAGIFSFSICYALQILLFHHVIADSGWLTLMYAISLPASGFFVLHYWNYLTAFYRYWSFASLFGSRKSQVAMLMRKRTSILNDLDDARREYNSFIIRQKAETKEI